ncbi:unnamed protein product, partial [Clonostachys rosea f. rosea IK726]
YVTFDKDKDNTVDNSEDRPGNDAACAPQGPTATELVAACVLLQLANPEGRTLIEVATEDQCMQLQALNGEADSAEWITKQNEVLDDSGYGKSIDGTLIHGDNQVMPPRPDVFGQQPKSQSSANTPMSSDGLNCYCCETTWKNESKLRPFICDRNGCSKKEVGFATNNELVRHKRTVHGDNLKTTFICTRGDCAKENPPKRWPRADNFRAHLKRVHKIEQVSVIDLQHYSTSSESVAEGGPFATLDDDTENEKVGVEINEDKFGKSFNGLDLATMLQAALRQKREASQSSASIKGPECNTCGEKFRRPCDLRKHIKRHEKPYGCTFYLCKKTFGSKNDWKRHEGRQHPPPEMWECETNCGKVFGSRDLFKLHLEDLHHEMSPPIKEAKLEDNRSASSFWCGFCCCIVRVVSDTSDPQGVRFDHIGDHFMGRRDQSTRNISEWLYIENTSTEREVTTAERAPSSQGNVRKRKLNAASDARPPKQLRWPSIERSRDIFLPFEFGLYHKRFQFQPPAGDIDSIKKNLNQIHSIDRSPPIDSLSSLSSLSSRPPERYPSVLSMPHQLPFHPQPLELSRLSEPSSFSPRSTPFSHTGRRSPQESVDMDRSPRTRSSRNNSDDTSVHGGYEYYGAEEMEIEETSSLKRLQLGDICLAGQKRRAPSDDLLQRGEANPRGSPTPRLATISQGVPIPSLSRSSSYISNISVGPSSAATYDRRSPRGQSPNGISPTSTASPYTTPKSLNPSPRGSISGRATGHHRNVSGASPRKIPEIQKPGLKMQGFFICECCPKKPKKFETAEDLKAHEAEKQYNCQYCGNRFKNKNEAEQHQNSLHVRRHSWSELSMSQPVGPMKLTLVDTAARTLLVQAVVQVVMAPDISPNGTGRSDQGICRITTNLANATRQRSSSGRITSDST